MSCLFQYTDYSDDSVNTADTGSLHEGDHNVEKVLASRDHDLNGNSLGEVEFLIKWEGLPINMAKWIPASTAPSEAIREHEKDVEQGTESPFDVEAFENARIVADQARPDRKRRRAEKLRRRGKPVSPKANSQPEADAQNVDMQSIFGDSPIEASQSDDDPASRPLFASSVRVDAHAESGRKSPSPTMSKGHENGNSLYTAPQKATKASRVTKQPVPTMTPNTDRKRRRNIFQNHDKPLKPRQKAAANARAPKLYTTLQTKNRASKRSQREPHPNPDALIMVDPATGKTEPPQGSRLQTNTGPTVPAAARIDKIADRPKPRAVPNPLSSEDAAVTVKSVMTTGNVDTRQEDNTARTDNDPVACMRDPKPRMPSHTEQSRAPDCGGFFSNNKQNNPSGPVRDGKRLSRWDTVGNHQQSHLSASHAPHVSPSGSAIHSRADDDLRSDRPNLNNTKSRDSSTRSAHQSSHLGRGYRIPHGRNAPHEPVPSEENLEERMLISPKIGQVRRKRDGNRGSFEVNSNSPDITTTKSNEGSIHEHQVLTRELGSAPSEALPPSFATAAHSRGSISLSRSPTVLHSPALLNARASPRTGQSLPLPNSATRPERLHSTTPTQSSTTPRSVEALHRGGSEPGAQTPNTSDSAGSLYRKGSTPPIDAPIRIPILLDVRTGEQHLRIPAHLECACAEGLDQIPSSEGRQLELSITEMMMAADLQKLCPNLMAGARRPPNGFIVPQTRSRPYLKKMALIGSSHLSIFVARCEHSVILFSLGDDVWRFPDDTNVPPRLEAPMPFWLIPSSSWSMPTPSSLQPSHATVEWSHVVDLDKSKLFDPHEPKNGARFAMMMMSFDHVKESALLAQFLRGEDYEVCHGDESGAWAWFREINVSGERVIFVHPDMDLSSIPGLQDLLLKTADSTSVFSWGLNRRIHLLEDETPHFSCERLFPYGEALFITDDVFLYYPSKASAIINYFIKHGLNLMNHKIVTRPGVENWLCKILNDPKMPTNKCHVQLYSDMLWLSNSALGDPTSTQDYLSRPATPLVSNPIEEFEDSEWYRLQDSQGSNGNRSGGNGNHLTDPKATTLMVEWFAGWASYLQSHKIRHFIVCHMGADPQSFHDKENWAAKWQHLAVEAPDDTLARWKNKYGMHDVDDEDELEPGEIDEGSSGGGGPDFW